MPDFIPMGAYTLHSETPQLMVSPTGRHLLTMGPGGELQLHDLERGVLVFSVDGLPPERFVDVSVSSTQILIATNRLLYTFEYGRGEVAVEVTPLIPGVVPRTTAELRHSSTSIPESQGGYDPNRFGLSFGDQARCVVDKYNCLWIFDGSSELVATLSAARGAWGIQMADGACWGKLSRSGMLSHPAKSRELARTLRALWEDAP